MGKLGILGGRLLPLKYPRQNPDSQSQEGVLPSQLTIVECYHCTKRLYPYFKINFLI